MRDFASGNERVAPRGAYDVAVVGLGHAGAEAALAAARLGARVAALTLVPERACLMSCNPAIGGPGKSQLVKEIDALGGAMGRAADASAIQVRLLNRSKGPAGWATRLQVDRSAYARAMQAQLRSQEGLTVVHGEAVGVVASGSQVQGLALADGTTLPASAVVLTTGTFLSARMHVGHAMEAGGRAGDVSSDGLSRALRALGLALGRFKTGTPPRLEGDTIDWALCELQPSEADVGPFSRSSSPFPLLPQRPTYITRTSLETHAIVAGALSQSPLTSGAVSAKGPRYCPSLEQKVVGFPERASHLVYLEPDGLDTSEVYPAGLSTSLPAAVQLALLRTIPGLAQVELRRPGYAVEYDYCLSGQLERWFETKALRGLYLAGQINGSSGYEEAAGQGLIAGINAVRRLRALDPWVPTRAEAYLGVLCDDLTQKVFAEPYRILPSRVEHRLMVREDNAELRLGELAGQLGLTPAARAEGVGALRVALTETLAGLSEAARRWLRQPERTLAEGVGPGGPLEQMPSGWAGDRGLELARQVFWEVRYAPYATQQKVSQQRLGALADTELAPDLAWSSVPGLSAEARAALATTRPTRLGQAAALPGIGPEAVALIVAHLRRQERLRSVSRGTSL